MTISSSFLLYSVLQIFPEAKERWYPADSLKEYAERMWYQCCSNNPFSPVDDTVLPPDQLQQFHERFVAEVLRTGVDRLSAGKGVRSNCTVLHVLASCSAPGKATEPQVF